MKKLIFNKTIVLCVVLITIVTSCSKGDTLKNVSNFNNYEIIKIDSCEYIMYSSAYGMLHVTHKGNCNNEIHNYSKPKD